MLPLRTVRQICRLNAELSVLGSDASGFAAPIVSLASRLAPFFCAVSDKARVIDTSGYGFHLRFPLECKTSIQPR